MLSPDLISSPTCPLFFSCLIIIEHIRIHQYIWNTSSVKSIVLKTQYSNMGQASDRFMQFCISQLGNKNHKKSKQNDANTSRCSEIKTSIKRTNLDALITQKGKNINRRTSHEMAKNPKHTLAASSFSEYLKTFAASMKTSLASCRARTTEPIRTKLKWVIQITTFKREFL